MTLDEKRKTEAALTSEFVGKNKGKLLEIAKCLAAKFDTGMRDMKNFYLKGGNAFYILDKEGGSDLTGKDAPEGDYDFQFVPDESVYDCWQNKIKKIDENILCALKETAKEYKNGFNTDCFKDENIIQLLSKNIDGHPSDIKITARELVSGAARIGAKYLTLGYSEVAKAAMAEPDKRIKLDTADFCSETIAEGCEPSVYVNYTIPGFILYRMVYKFRYTAVINGRQQKFSLKSEIADISVPRVGSGEVYMSQEGVVTNFRKKCDFNIPGWGYHLYENINLIQEIDFGISGSAHKKAKREARLKRAAEALIKANGGAEGTFKDITALLGYTVSEPYSSTESKEILGYYSALIYSLKDNDDFKDVIGKIYKNCVDAYFNDLLKWLGDSLKWKALHKFKTNDRFALTVSDIKTAVNVVINGCNESLSYKSIRISTQYLSPFLYADNRFKCAFDYAEIGVADDSSFNYLISFCNKKTNCSLSSFANINSVTFSPDGAAVLTMTVNKKETNGCARILYVIIRKHSVTPESILLSAKKMLSLCILESQRYSLTWVVQNYGR